MTLNFVDYQIDFQSSMDIDSGQAYHGRIDQGWIERAKTYVRATHF